MSSQTVFVTAGKTSFSHDIVLVQNAGATSPGDPILSVAFNSSGLIAYYRIPTTGANTSITLATQTVTGAYSSGGFVLISDTNAPGKYRFDPPNAVLASAGVSSVTISGFAGLATHTIFYVCMGVDLFGVTNVPSNVLAWNGTTLTGKTGALPGLAVIDSGTAQGGGGSTMTVRAANAFADNIPNGSVLSIIGGTGAGQNRGVIGFVNSTKVATVDPAWITNPDATSVYEWLVGAPAATGAGIPSVNMVQQAGVTVNTPFLTSGTAQAGGNNTITLASGASATNGLYDPGLIRIVGGTGVGQARMILSYDGTTKIAVLDRDWRTNPDSTSIYEVTAIVNTFSTNEGMAAGGASGSITLNATASATDNYYEGQLVRLPSGIGQDQVRIIISYVGSTKVATVDRPWLTTPTTGSAYQVIPLGDAYNVLWSDATTELSAVPAVTTNLATMLKWVFTVGRNKRTQTATTQLLRNDADSATIGTSTDSDDGTTATRGKFL